MGAGPNAVGAGRRTWSTASAGRRSVAGQARSRPQGERIRGTRFSAGKDGELLPLARDEATLVVFNVTTVLDALDVDRSALVTFPSTGRIMKVKSYVFRPERLRAVNAFKVPQLLRGSAFFTDEVVVAVEGACLPGWLVLLCLGRSNGP